MLVMLVVYPLPLKSGEIVMEAVEQSGQCGIEATAGVQGAKMSSMRRVIMSVAVVTAFYIVWGIYKIVS